MKRKGSIKAPSRVIALALTWDGARWPRRRLPLKAQKFLKTVPGKLTEKGELAQLCAQDEVKELRLCWVPKLVGGEEVLCQPFFRKEKRLAFRITQIRSFDYVLCVVYRRLPSSSTSSG